MNEKSPGVYEAESPPFGSVTLQLLCPAYTDSLEKLEQLVISALVMLLQRDRISSEAIASQVQLVEEQEYCGMAHGRVGSVLKSEL